VPDGIGALAVKAGGPVAVIIGFETYGHRSDEGALVRLLDVAEDVPYNVQRVAQVRAGGSDPHTCAAHRRRRCETRFTNNGHVMKRASGEQKRRTRRQTSGSVALLDIL
jgi:hypothetical protein